MAIGSWVAIGVACCIDRIIWKVDKRKINS